MQPFIQETTFFTQAGPPAWWGSAHHGAFKMRSHNQSNAYASTMRKNGHGQAATQFLASEHKRHLQNSLVSGVAYKTYIDVPYVDKEQAKAFGAQAEKIGAQWRWFIPAWKPLKNFIKWMKPEAVESFSRNGISI